MCQSVAEYLPLFCKHHMTITCSMVSQSHDVACTVIFGNSWCPRGGQTPHPTNLYTTASPRAWVSLCQPGSEVAECCRSKLSELAWKLCLVFLLCLILILLSDLFLGWGSIVALTVCLVQHFWVLDYCTKYFCISLSWNSIDNLGDLGKSK